MMEYIKRTYEWSDEVIDQNINDTILSQETYPNNIIQSTRYSFSIDT